jgi:hypothetical protein
MEIDWRGRRIVQRLDYLRIPFRCSYCHETGHLRKTCKGRVEEEISENTALHRDWRENDEEVNSTGLDYDFSQKESSPSPERLDTLSGKLSLFVRHFIIH